MSLSLSCFPHKSKNKQTNKQKKNKKKKNSETSPVKNVKTILRPQNYRLPSVLTCLSKISERIHNDQMGVYSKDKLSTLLYAFRKRKTIGATIYGQIDR